jgi:hypothetical protein
LAALAAAGLAESGSVPTLLQAPDEPVLCTANGDEVLLLSPVATRVLFSCDVGDNTSGLPPPVSLRGADLADLVSTVEAMHAAGWAHRDIKPDNVMYDTVTQRVMLIDFDIAVPLDVPGLAMWRGELYKYSWKLTVLAL